MTNSLEWLIILTDNYRKSRSFYKDVLELETVREVPEEEFNQFKAMVAETWPGMSISAPEYHLNSKFLEMYCEEERYSREMLEHKPARVSHIR